MLPCIQKDKSYPLLPHPDPTSYLIILVRIARGKNSFFSQRLSDCLDENLSKTVGKLQ